MALEASATKQLETSPGAPRSRGVRVVGGRTFTLFLLAGLCGSVGCSWHGARAEYVFGPALVRHRAAMPGGDATFIQTVAFPLALEAGSQWNITAGWLDRLAVAAVERNELTPEIAAPPANRATATTSWKPVLYFALPFDRPREFIVRRRAGVTAGAGEEYVGIGAGWSRTTRFRSEDHRAYILNYSSVNASDVTFETWSATNLAFPANGVHSKQLNERKKP